MRFYITVSLFFVFIIAFDMSISAQTGKYATLGVASYYHSWLAGKKTANGERYNESQMTAAHLNLPFNSKVKVTNLYNKKSVIVRINDRGPFINRRIIDLSRAAADSLGFIFNGLTKVQLTILSYGKPQTYIASANLLKKSPLAKESSSEHLSIIPFETAMPFEEETNIFTDNTVTTNDTLTFAVNINSTPKTIKGKTAETIHPIVIPDTLQAKVVKPTDSFVIAEVKPKETVILTIVQDTLTVDAVKTTIKEIITNEKITAVIDAVHTVDTFAANPDVAVKNSNTVSLNFGLQIGSFKLRDNAAKLTAKMKANYNDICIEEIKKENASFYRVIIGKFADEKEAIMLKEKLNNLFPASFIVRH
ncbi:MAG: septal ring lytic transglycosylase RlpA family protein [Bacteroidetes bacterium]|nr:septal ring lytic transglycosylase RlpA family protein [Bacteroidota bacterium]